MQSIVLKLVPHVQEEEERRRREFYLGKEEGEQSAGMAAKGVESALGRYWEGGRRTLDSSDACPFLTFIGQAKSGEGNAPKKAKTVGCCVTPYGRLCSVKLSRRPHT